MSRPLTEFRDVLLAMEESDSPYCLVGGHAVIAWAMRYLTPEEITALGMELPLLSKDLDARAGKLLALYLKEKFQGQIIEAKLKNIKRGKAWIVHIGELTIEIMQTLPGINTSATEKPAGYRLSVPSPALGFSIRVIDPVSCLQAKLDVLHRELEANESGKRNDLKHALLLTKLMPHYLRELEKMPSNFPTPAGERERLAHLPTFPNSPVQFQEALQDMLTVCQIPLPPKIDKHTDGPEGNGPGRR